VLRAMDGRPDAFGDRGIEEVGADRGRRVEAEQQHEQRRHQRAASDARQTDERADKQACDRIERIVRGKDRCPLAHTINRHEFAAFCPGSERALLCRSNGPWQVPDKL
jgi:hypothetical protein